MYVVNIDMCTYIYNTTYTYRYTSTKCMYVPAPTPHKAWARSR